MSILEEIQDAAVNSNSDVAAVLRKCKVLAVRLGSQPLEDWLVWESNGYPPNVPVPDYRVWPLEVFGYFEGPSGNTRTAPIPLTALRFIKDDVKQSYKRYECRDSVASAESTLSKVSGNVQVSTGELAIGIGTKLYTDYNCLQAWAEYHPSRLVEMLNFVRNRVLDFSLAVWKEAPTAGEIGAPAGTNPEPARVNQIFNTAVYGGSANFVGAAQDSKIEFNIAPRDFSGLERVLGQKGVSTEDVGELKEALDADPAPSTPEKFGPKVSSWMGKMVGKAADGTWKIGVGAAGNILAEVIARYYGLK
jgi:hypothetical protein